MLTSSISAPTRPCLRVHGFRRAWPWLCEQDAQSRQQPQEQCGSLWEALVGDIAGQCLLHTPGHSPYHPPSPQSNQVSLLNSPVLISKNFCLELNPNLPYLNPLYSPFLQFTNNWWHPPNDVLVLKTLVKFSFCSFLFSLLPWVRKYFKQLWYRRK